MSASNRTGTTALLESNRGARRRKPALAERLVLGRLERIEDGLLTVARAGELVELGRRAADGLAARVEVHDPRFFQAVMLRGSVGAGEAYARRWWTSDDPTAVVRVFARNEAALSEVDSGVQRVSRPLLAAWHALRRNTERGSKANIGAHYDLSNEFFALFLDETMTYSCGIFEDDDATLRDASVAKLDRLCRKLRLRPEDRLLEIGTGWGSLALHAAREYGCHVTTTTISERQHALAAERIRAAGLEGRVTLLKRDYRRLEGRFDKLVSVEMIEAVGHHYFGAFFERCADLLEPDGLMCLQAITIADQHYARARRSVDFIKRHIFPGACIPSVTALLDASTRASDLRLVHMEDLTPHYARTLACWRANLLGRRADALALGFDDELLRLWEFYFAYCEGGFAERRIGDVQMLMARPGARTAPLLPELEPCAS